MIGINEHFSEQHRKPDIQNLTRDIFSNTGTLVRDLLLEHRPEQETMANHVAHAFANDAPLLFEAGTGVGKSLAYLIPAIIRAVDQERQCLISTHTIALQEQIKQKDLQICRRLFESVPSFHRYKEFKNAMLVGRGNYLCPTRLAQAIQTKAELFPTEEQQELDRIANWSTLTSTGLIQELNPPPRHEVWEWVNADSSACNNRNCNPKVCFFRKARQEMRSAQILILNHSLLFALLGTNASHSKQTQGILFPKDFAVIDEAHRVAAVATEHLGHHISSYGLNRLLKMLYNSKRKKGLLRTLGSADDCLCVENAIATMDHFFSGLEYEILKDKTIARVYKPQWYPDIVNHPFTELIERISSRANKLDSGSAKDELLDLRNRLKSYRDSISRCISLADESQVYWVERTGRQGKIITLRTAPIDVAPLLRECLFNRKTGIVLTSATMADGPDMSSFAARVGAEDQYAVQVNSPFDFERNMRVFVATDTPPPTQDKKRLDIEFLAENIAYCTTQFRGGTLVLFTSYHDMSLVSNKLTGFFAQKHRPFYVQGKSGSRTELARRLTEDGNGILFGTDSFWTGIDIPGPSLSQVIIARLPFDNPSHPIAEAKSDFIRQQGKKPFMDLTLPDALVKFRQGVGRLIRNTCDQGSITLLDSRIIHKAYGRHFLQVLPNPNFTTFNRQNRLERFQPLEYQ